MLAFSWPNQVRLGNVKPNNWEDLTKEEYDKRRENLSKSSSGSLNSQFGTHIYIDKSFPVGQKLPEASEVNKHRYKPGQQPEGWITIQEWRDLGKNKLKAAYGKHWYTDGEKNYFLNPSNEIIKENNLKLGRVNCNPNKNSQSNDCKTKDAKDIGDAGGGTSPDPPVNSLDNNVVTNGSDKDSI